MDMYDEKKSNGKTERKDSSCSRMNALKLLISFMFLVAGSLRLASSDGLRGIPELIITDQESDSIASFSLSDQKSFLLSHGHLCTPILGGRYSSSNPIIHAYNGLEEIAEHDSKRGRAKDIQSDLWKFCAMAAGYASTYVNANQVHFPSEVGIPDVFRNDVRNIVIQANFKDNSEDAHMQMINSAIISLGRTESGRILSMKMLQLLMTNVDMLLAVKNYGSWKGNELFRLVKDASTLNPSEWSILISQCVSIETTGIKSSNLYSTVGLCTRSGGSPCCEVAYSTSASSTSGVFLVSHGIEKSTYEHQTTGASFISQISESIPQQGAVPFENNARHLSPRLFEMLLDNDCLPSHSCHRCLSKQNGGDLKSQCSACSASCACYCEALCKIRPHKMKLEKELHVQIPTRKRNSSSLIPKIIHQTYFEPVTKEKYPNFSRLVESWKQSSWDYNFYSDEDARTFLSSHFPPEVREAYDALIPGAYKADLFRYCILLIRGGIYADVDVLLSVDLDKLVQNDVGFMVPVDEPGRMSGAGSCLWNGFLAAAPGHPFLARTIEMVVNSIRNRYTSVDFDDMLCPRSEHHRLPDLDLSHSFDLLYLTGPCIIGAALNDVLGRHMQTQIPVGELNVHNETSIWQTDFLPGRTIILGQNKNDMGAHRFNYVEKNMLVATTDMPDYDDRKGVKHYSDSNKVNSLFGTKGIYQDLSPANELIRLVIQK